MKDIQPEILIQKIDDAEIQYLHYKSSGPPLVLMHATGFNPWLWHPIARKLAPQYRVIAPYFCDHREGAPETGGVSWLFLARDLAHLCKKLSIDNPYMAGHSMGATVSIIAHAKYGLPAMKMMLIEPILLPEMVYDSRFTVDQHPLAAKSLKRRNTWADEDEAREYLKSKKLFARWNNEMMELYVHYGMKADVAGGLELSCNPRREAALFMGGNHYNPWPLLKKIKCPVMVVEGGTSENKMFIDLHKVAALIPGGAYHEVSKAGHLIPMEKPDEIAHLMLEFFS
jgi:lipase